MKFFKVFLFYFSLIATNILLLASYFLLPSPQNIATTVILTPVAFFFWVYATDPSSVTASTWSVRFLVVVLILIPLGIFSYFLSAKYLPKSAPLVDPTLGEIKQNLQASDTKDDEFKMRLEKEILQLKEKIDILGAKDAALSSLPSSLGQITAKDPNAATISVYKEKSAESEVVGQVKPGINYPFFESSEGWYLIEGGWVEASFFTEVSRNQ